MRFIKWSLSQLRRPLGALWRIFVTMTAASAIAAVVGCLLVGVGCVAEWAKPGVLDLRLALLCLVTAVATPVAAAAFASVWEVTGGWRRYYRRGLGQAVLGVLLSGGVFGTVLFGGLALWADQPWALSRGASRVWTSVQTRIAEQQGNLTPSEEAKIEEEIRKAFRP